MSFRTSLKLIAPAAWFIATVVWIVMALLLSMVITKDLAWPERLILTVLVPSFLFAYILLIGYIARDTGRRGMRKALWVVLAILIPNGIGVILYFLLREPVLRACPSCGALARHGFVYCPKCGAAVSPLCAGCGRGLEPAWAACPYCGKRTA